MSDYLSSLVARSLRREPACEPRRAQMFEPRQETPGASLAAEAAGAGLPGTEMFEEVTPDKLQKQSPLQIPLPPSQTSHPRTSEDAPAVAEQPPRSTSPVEAVHEAMPAPTEVSGVKPASHDMHDVKLMLQTPPPHVNAASPDSERVVTPAVSTEEVPRARPSTPTVNTSPASPSRLLSATAVEQSESLSRSVRVAAVDEESREETPPVERRLAAEPRAGRLESEGRTTVVDLEVVPQPRKSPASTVRAVTTTEARPVAEARLIGAQPQPANARGEALSPSPQHVASRDGGAERAEQPPPTIEVTIGRIEVRAVTPPAPPQQQRVRQSPPKMSLDDYLRANSGGRK